MSSFVSSFSSSPTSHSSQSEGTFQVLKKIGSSKFNVFLVWCSQAKEFYALKVFPFENQQLSYSFKNESRFVGISHPNIISLNRVNPEQRCMRDGDRFKCSYILMELAPYGDFASLNVRTKLFQEEKLLRTYFYQLIAGIEHLHAQGIAHMDLKLDNLLMGKDFKLKISDFDSTISKEDTTLHGRGTKNYRAPEIKAMSCPDPEAADIYSAGIILFTLKTGNFPYVEDCKTMRFEQLLQAEDPEFWDLHSKYHKTSISESFKELFFMMVKQDVVERATIDEIKKSEWYNGPIYSPEELGKKMKRHIAQFDMLKKFI